MKRHSNSSPSLSVASDPPLPVLIAVDPLPEAPPTQPPLYRQIKLALDVHAGDLMVVRRVDGAKPQPPQKMSYDNFLRWVVKQKSQAKEVFSCYEAGPTGYWLHRKLIEIGIVNYVVCPTCLEVRRSGVNNDKSDALELATRLDRYLAGNHKSFSIVTVPSEIIEQKRARKRQRQQLRQQRLSMAAQGRCLMLLMGRKESNNWWKLDRWEFLKELVSTHLLEQLEIFRDLILVINKAVQDLSKRIEADAPKVLPKGMGRLTHENIETEVRDWNRFSSRRAIASYSGLTGGVSSSGESRSDLSITKAGNRRLRTELVELSWRFLLYQPDDYLVKKWGFVLNNPKAHSRARRRAIIAFARQLLVDLWRWKTGRRTPEQFGWIMTEA